jgi:hypothetical protein
MNSRIVYLFAFFMSISSCHKMPWLQDDELSLKRRDYNADGIRVDGYFYRIVEETTYDESYGQSIFFYRNGVVLDAGGFPLSAQNDFETDILEKKYEDIYKNSKYNWGVFQIMGDTVKFEKWYPSSGGGLPVYIREGIIINDSVFHIVRSYRNTEDGIEEERDKDEMYYFHRLEYKPDSTNTFIE